MTRTKKKRPEVMTAKKLRRMGWKVRDTVQADPAFAEKCQRALQALNENGVSIITIP